MQLRIYSEPQGSVSGEWVVVAELTTDLRKAMDAQAWRVSHPQRVIENESLLPKLYRLLKNFNDATRARLTFELKLKVDDN